MAREALNGECCDDEDAACADDGATEIVSVDAGVDGSEDEEGAGSLPVGLLRRDGGWVGVASAAELRDLRFRFRPAFILNLKV